jgi:hypothetical protein
MVDQESVRLLEAAGSALGGSVTVLLFIRRSIDVMITRKVREQVSEAMRSVTETNSKQNEQLREEVRADLHEYNAAAEQRTKNITDRIDSLMLRLQR